MTRPEPILTLQDVRLTYRTRRLLWRSPHKEVLRGISFDVYPGETIGLIGGNGCGKSTLLRVVAGIYHPDAGHIIRRCRSVSLLSLSLGFDEALSGRDNAILSGMLLGSPRATVLEHLDEIIEFAELSDSIGDPLKTYSTGMRARLGFSIALKMHTELLLIDEVLGVGDLRFQAKSRRAMVEKVTSEQSVILVSHSMEQIKRLCNRVAWIESGIIRRIGEPGEVVEKYRAFMRRGAVQARLRALP